jgi:hypothetical protein
MIIVQSDSLQRPLVIFLVIVANAIVIGSLTIIIIITRVSNDYNKMFIFLIIILYNYNIMITKFISLFVIQLMVDMCHYLICVT